VQRQQRHVSCVPAVDDVGVKSLLALVLAACPSQRGTVNGVSVDSIIPDMAGPILYDDAIALHQGSRDFLVKWIGA
jgi:hypothetical protein